MAKTVRIEEAYPCAAPVGEGPSFALRATEGKPRVRVLIGALLAALAAPVGAAQLDTVEPRPFGYTVGDVLERQLLVDPSREGKLDPASLPRPGRYGRWFQLRSVTPAAGGVRLDYQIVNTPAQPDRENLPSLSVRVIGPDGSARDAQVGPFTVAMAPVVQFGPAEIVQADNVRPEMNPRPIDTSGARRRVFAYTALLIALIVLQLAPALARRVGWRQAGPFARALRALRRRRLRGDDVATRSDALRRLHQALDEATGSTLALDNVERLLVVQPWLAPARAGVEALLAQSRATFFGDAPPPSRANLHALAAQLADLERRR
jgi:mxaA protein